MSTTLQIFTKRVLFLTAAMAFCQLTFIHAQGSVGVGTLTPDASAALDIVSADKGILIPRADTASIASPAVGLMTFQPSNSTFYYYNGTRWARIGGAVIDADGDTRIVAIDGPGSSDTIAYALDGVRKLTMRSNAAGDLLLDLNDATRNNTFLGRRSGEAVIDTGLSDDGESNVGIGTFALLKNTIGSVNTAIGASALLQNTSGSNNTAIGASALFSNLTGDQNTALGWLSLGTNAANSRSTSIGYSAMLYADNRISGRLTYNTAVGHEALRGSFSADANTGRYNTAIGDQVMLNNSSGQTNTAMGIFAMQANTTGNFNTAVGSSALISNTEGHNNVAYGSGSLSFNTVGSSNLAIGLDALQFNTTGSSNTALGDSSLLNNKANTRSTAVGFLAMKNADDRTSGRKTYNTALGYSALSGGASPSSNTGQHNTAVGDSAMANNTTGSWNAALGSSALTSNKAGDFNTANGVLALWKNTDGPFNTAVGYSALSNNTIGGFNTAVGKLSLVQNTTGGQNVAVGSNALFRNKANNRSTAIGYQAMQNADDRTSGRSTYNTAVGYEALKGSNNQSNNTGQYNTAIGDSALASNTDGGYNSALGKSALTSNTTGYENTALGSRALAQNTSGSGNTATGYLTLALNTFGFSNTAYGSYALNQNISGNYNTTVGYNALTANILGYENTVIGDYAGFNSVGNRNVFIGNEAAYFETGSDKLYIENSNATESDALIYGQFNDNKLRFNATLGIGILPNQIPINIKANTTNDLIQYFDNAGVPQWHTQIFNNGFDFVESGVVGNRLHLAAGGNIGIGTGFPGEMLHIYAAVDPTILLQSDGTNELAGKVSMRDFSMTGTDMYYDGADSTLVFETFTNGGSNGNKMLIRDDGNVGIGQDLTRDSLLDNWILTVRGGVACEDLLYVAPGDWPDYVFADDYKLMPLEALQTEINKNGHLPGIPSAAETAEEGVRVGVMQSKLLEKVEELTLYIIDINTQLQELKSENEKLASEIKDMKNN